METKIQTKFVIATDSGVKTMKALTQRIMKEKFSTLMDGAALEKYIADTYSDKQLIDGMNAMGNQWLVVYRNDEPVGYCYITDKGMKPAALSGKRAVRIADFGVLKEFQDEPVEKSLLDKCLAVVRNVDALWIQEYAGNPFLSFFESRQFVRQVEKSDGFELPVPSVLLIKVYL